MTTQPQTAAPSVTPITQPGVYRIPAAGYHADPVPGRSLSSSGARLLLPPSCPALFRYQQDHPPAPKPHFDHGHAAHKLVLGEGDPLVVVDAADWRTQQARDARDQAHAEGATPILAADYEHVQAMASAIHAHPIASALFDPGHGEPEQSLFWQDPDTGVWCRARPDWLPEPGLRDRLIVGEYKTTRSADPAEISRSIASYGYHQQAAFYTTGIQALGLAAEVSFVFVFQEKEPPYLITVAELDTPGIQLGHDLNRAAIQRYRDCTDSGIWPGYSDDVELIGLPAWAYYRRENL